MGSLWEEEEEAENKTRGYSINDNADLLAEILGRLDGRSLGAAACVCRLWRAVSRRDSVWESLCTRRVAAGGGGQEARAVVAALGGYRRLYELCLGPALDRLSAAGRAGPAWAVDEAHLTLSLSLFSIDCYERLGGRPRSSLLFLSANPVDVS